MNVKGIDPRDIDSEMTAVYRVYFWSDSRRRSDEYELTDATDVREVLGWIDANAHGREVEAMVVVDRCAAFLIGPLDHSGSN
jgi:hypothetical protein